jgi:hypothetical protein
MVELAEQARRIQAVDSGTGTKRHVQNRANRKGNEVYPERAPVQSQSRRPKEHTHTQHADEQRRDQLKDTKPLPVKTIERTGDNAGHFIVIDDCRMDQGRGTQQAKHNDCQSKRFTRDGCPKRPPFLWL